MLRWEGAEVTYMYFRIHIFFFSPNSSTLEKTHSVINKNNNGGGFLISNEIMGGLFLFFIFINFVKILQTKNDRSSGGMNKMLS